MPVDPGELLRFIPANDTGSYFVTNPPQHRPNLIIVSTSISSPPNRNPVSDDLPSADPATTSPLAQRDRVVKRWVTVIAAVLLICVLFLLIRLQGQVSGVEFAPTHFQQRSFSFFEIPLIHLQITPIRRSAVALDTANYLRVNSLVKTRRGSPKTWHLVSMTRGLTGATPADAQLLSTQLSLEHGGDQYWRTWSIDHPRHAKVLWPIVQDLAVRELYIVIPPLFEIAQLEQTPSELEAALNARLKKDLALLIQDLRSAGRNELADQILAEALRDYPGEENLLRLHSTVLEKTTPAS